MRLKCFIILLFACFCMVSCADVQEPNYDMFTLSPTVYEFKKEGESMTFHLASGSEWHISKIPSWLSVTEITPADKPYEWDIELSCNENTSTTRYQEIVEFTAGDNKPLTITVSQPGDKPYGIPVKKVVLTHTSLILSLKQTVALMVTVSPDDASIKTLEWSSSDDAIVSISGKGSAGANITGESEGEAVITVRAVNGENDASASCIVTVRENPWMPATGITFEPGEISLNDGADPYKLVPVFLPKGADPVNLVWETNDDTIASVSLDGEVTANFPGEAIITASSEDRKMTAQCRVTVKPVFPEAIDLGLPSGLKWGYLVFGAHKENKNGDYFAWGETKPKEQYNWENYKFGPSNAITKYNEADQYKVLEPKDDIASLFSKDEWRMPEVCELKELIDEANSKISFENSNVVATSIHNNKKVSYRGYTFWSASLYDDNKQRAYFLQYNTTKDAAVIHHYSRCSGGFVIPVKGPRPTHITSFNLPSSEKELTLEPGKTAQLHVQIEPDKATYKKLKCTSSNTDVAKVTEEGLITAIGGGQAIITVEAAYEDNCRDECNIIVPVNVQTPEAVDMGLPTEVLWGSFNIGAASPQEEGFKFAWGETEPKDPYNWDNYIWGTSSAITRYNDTDKYKVLLPENDVAAVKLGSYWRMPTVQEVDDLLNDANCDWKIEGNGYTVTSKITKNSIYFPISQSYWTASRYSTVSKASGYDLTTSTKKVVTTDRSVGCLVRPVYDEPRNSTITPIDLGLSVKWASCNLGAIGENGYGDYYAFAETEPKDEYTQENCKYYVGNGKYSKYVSNSQYSSGTPDNKTALDKEDDAAAVNLGGTGSWGIPTEDEWRELSSKCDWEPRDNGFILTGPNGNSIFLPASYGTSVSGSNNGKNGRYRCSTTDSNPAGNKPSVFYFSISSGRGKNKGTITSTDRYLGLSVRPVLREPVNSVSIVPSSASIEEDEKIQLKASIDPPNATDQSVKWTSLSPDIAAVDENTGLVTPLKRGVATIKVTTNEGGKADDCQITIKAASFKAIDMGTSVKWANMNLGASRIEGFGDYYAWGATIPKYPYNPNNAPYYNNTYPYSALLSTLSLSDDAAYKKLGGKWRVPTYKDMKELKDNCTSTEWVCAGVPGMLITSRITGNSIFLPVAGCYMSYDGSTFYANSLVYWSATTGNRDSQAAYILTKANNMWTINLTQQFWKYEGCPIRPVYVE